MHSFIAGMTGSGKSALAKKLCPEHRTLGRKTLVYDPIGYVDWEADKIVRDRDSFLTEFWGGRNLSVFIDEAADTIGQFDREMVSTATKGRHWGHICFYISQRTKRVNPTVIANCSDLFLFCSSREDCDMLSTEFNEPKIKEAADFPIGTCLWVTRFGKEGKREVRKIQLFKNNS